MSPAELPLLLASPPPRRARTPWRCPPLTWPPAASPVQRTPHAVRLWSAAPPRASPGHGLPPAALEPAPPAQLALAAAVHSRAQPALWRGRGVRPPHAASARTQSQPTLPQAQTPPSGEALPRSRQLVASHSSSLSLAKGHSSHDSSRGITNVAASKKPTAPKHDQDRAGGRQGPDEGRRRAGCGGGAVEDSGVPPQTLLWPCFRARSRSIPATGSRAT